MQERFIQKCVCGNIPEKKAELSYWNHHNGLTFWIRITLVQTTLKEDKLELCCKVACTESSKHMQVNEMYITCPIWDLTNGHSRKLSGFGLTFKSTNISQYTWADNVSCVANAKLSLTVKIWVDLWPVYRKCSVFVSDPRT